MDRRSCREHFGISHCAPLRFICRPSSLILAQMATMTLLQVLFSLLFPLYYSFAQDHIQCVDNGLGWYASVVGETPCRTYERLRQICNSNYVLDALNPHTPPDTCGDQVADCCCNSIAFGLSMLCLTCQQGVGPNGNGVDAGIGAYQLYLKHGTNSFCTSNTKKSFTNGIQTAVCNNGLKIHNSFYDAIFWADGPCTCDLSSMVFPPF
ncbi:hypothetical protein IW262DRAFT_896267 [Armillaria fumosa]|nr:hypothetical protein IW262DRAFT_896267 [Armillaria fumosa]